ncbi:MAG: extradiol dioxygenase [Candidatus Dormibacteraeota bacterium]|nr:extradiol dioxygenase [Candidatus Dormibacteraeota bacterium]
MISGVHTIIFSRDAEADRAFFKDVLGLDSIDSGGGWLIFALPPAELALHPTEEPERHELFLLCDDIEVTARELEKKGVPLKRPFDEPRWGTVTEIALPGGGRISLYQPKHALAHARTEASQTTG